MHDRDPSRTSKADASHDQRAGVFKAVSGRTAARDDTNAHGSFDALSTGRGSTAVITPRAGTMSDGKNDGISPRGQATRAASTFFMTSRVPPPVHPTADHRANESGQDTNGALFANGFNTQDALSDAIQPQREGWQLDISGASTARGGLEDGGDNPAKMQVSDRGLGAIHEVPNPQLPPATQEGESATLLDAVDSGVPGAVTVALKGMTGAQAARDFADPDVIMRVAKSGDRDAFESFFDAMVDMQSEQEVERLMRSAFHLAVVGIRGSKNSRPLVALSVLLQHGTKPTAADLINLSRAVNFEEVDECFFWAVACASNAFIPSLNLSFALDAAIEEARESERKVLSQLKREVDDLLADITSRLPKTVRGVSGGMAVCAALFEPNVRGARDVDDGGPLCAALHCTHRIVTFATTPLGMDYMVQKFTRGLPGLRNEDRVVMLETAHFDPREEGKGHESLTALSEGSHLGRALTAVGRGLAEQSLSRMTRFPGAHFITTGVVAMPNSYYKVPAVRMIFELLLYVGVLTLFVKEVLFLEDEPVEPGEVAFAAWALAAIIAEAHEMWTDILEYRQDRWNVLDVSALLLCLSGFAFRVLDDESAVGRGLYAIAAPLMFWRLLFFAQLLPFQGAMIQVVYAMASELVQFALVMGVVMLGFAVSFRAILSESGDVSFSGSLLKAFKAMLGEVSLFEEFEDTRYEKVGTLLLVVYMIIVGIMLLNLLIAVMSTSHSKIEENVLIRTSKARLFVYYRWVVRSDSLPPPFNVVQLLIALPWKLTDCACKRGMYTAARRFVGRVTFWIVLGPLAVIACALLWFMSAPKSVAMAWSGPPAGSKSIVSRVGRSLLCLLWSIVGMPLCLVLAWFTQAWNVCLGYTYVLTSSRPPLTIKPSVNDMLREATGGLGIADLRTCLKDPVACNNSHVNRDIRDDPTTIKHVQSLRRELETYVTFCVDDLKLGIEESISRKLGRLEAKIDTALAEVPSR